MRERPLLLFDGVCNLCHGTVRWVLARDRAQRFDFASLQSAAGREALREALQAAGIDEPLPPADSDPDSVVLIDARGVHLRSDAAIEVARGLGLPWSLAVVGRVLPRALRDPIYRWVARNRYRWFGRKEACGLPAPGQAERFLDANEKEVPAPAPPEGPS